MAIEGFPVQHLEHGLPTDDHCTSTGDPQKVSSYALMQERTLLHMDDPSLMPLA